jgi:hypothetical protein
MPDVRHSSGRLRSHSETRDLKGRGMRTRKTFRWTAVPWMVAAVLGAQLTAQAAGQVPAKAAAGETSRVSTSSTGAEANNRKQPGSR